MNHIAQCTNIIQNTLQLQDVKITLENRDEWRKTENSMDRKNEIRVRTFVETIKEKLSKRKEEPGHKRTLRGRKDLPLSPSHHLLDAVRSEVIYKARFSEDTSLE